MQLPLIRCNVFHRFQDQNCGDSVNDEDGVAVVILEEAERGLKVFIETLGRDDVHVAVRQQ